MTGYFVSSYTLFMGFMLATTSWASLAELARRDPIDFSLVSQQAYSYQSPRIPRNYPNINYERTHAVKESGGLLAYFRKFMGRESGKRSNYFAVPSMDECDLDQEIVFSA